MVSPLRRPAVASIAKVGGTKNPDVRAILNLAPELVIANAEENRREDIERLRAGGIPVFTTYPRTVPGAVESILRMGRALGRESGAAALAKQITLAVSGIEAALGVWSKLRLRVFCPIWKKPWMSFNADTYAHDVLRMLGYNNIYASAGERYPTVTLEEAIERRPDIVILPDEPYAFDESDVAELKSMLPPALGRRVLIVGGRDLHCEGRLDDHQFCNARPARRQSRRRSYGEWAQIARGENGAGACRGHIIVARFEGINLDVAKKLSERDRYIFRNCGVDDGGSGRVACDRRGASFELTRSVAGYRSCRERTAGRECR